MSWINRFGLTNEEAKVINQYSAPEQTGEALKPGLFEGVGSAMAQSLGMQFEASQSSLSEALAIRVEDSDYDLQQEDPFAPELDYNKDSIVNRLRQDAKEARLKIKNDYTPNPETTGAASMVLYGLTGSLAKGIGYSIAAGGNPILGGVMFGADLGRYEKDKLQDKGVDSETATKAGLITGVTNAVGMALPASVGTSYLKSAAFGGLVNPATDITEQSAIKFVLDHADYSVISKEYDPFDPVNLTTSSLMGVGFGLLGARGARVRAARESADDSVTISAAPDQPTSRMNKTVLESIQNRDRSGKESRLQMQQIAQAPDFNRLRNGSTLGEGTPVIAYLPEDSSAIMGKKVVVSDTNGGRTTMRYALVEASEVMTSNSADGSLNADFTNPEVAGARAIAGNGRIAGLQAAYQSVKATQYRAELTQAAKEFGISRRAVKKMREPVLVRVMEDADVKEGVGELSNRTGTLKLNPAEQAAQDARNVRLDEIDFTADNEITTKSMDEFVRRTPDKEGLIDANGNVIYDNVRRRMKPAILAAAFPDTRIINRFISDDPKDRQIMSLLQAVSPEVMRLKRIGDEFDFTGDLLEAVADYIQTKQEARKINGKDVEGELTSSLFEGSAVQSWFKDILLSKNPERLKDVLTRLREVVEQESGGEGFFGSVSREDVFNKVKSELGAFDRAVESITPSMVDAAMELRMADVIEGDQPSGMNGDINKSIADEKLAREQLDNGEKVNVSGEGVDPVAFGRQLADFRDTVFKNLLGLGFKEKLAAYSADIHEAFFRTLSDRLGVNAEEVVKRYGLSVRKGDKPNLDAGFFQALVSRQRERIESWLKPSEIETATGKTREEMETIFGTELEDIATVPEKYLKVIFGEEISDPRVYTSKAYFLDHVVNHHAPDVFAGDYREIQNIISNPDEVIRDTRINEKGVRRNGVIFTKRIGKTLLLAISLEETETGRLQLYKSLSKTRKKKPYPGMDRVALPVDALSENSKNPHDTFVSNNGHTAAGADFSALGKDSSIKDSSKESNSFRRGDDGNNSENVLFQSTVKSDESFRPDEALIDNAKETFGITDDIREAGYVLPDGTMLDFSGRHWGLDDSEARGQRQVDHIDIGETDGIKDATGNEMYDFMAQTGAMRVSMADGNSVASIAREPTTQQLAVLGRATNRKYLALSFNTPDGRIVSDIEFDSASLGKIERFLDEAQARYERGEVSGAYAQDARGMYTPAERMITLFGTADESTFIHESGHYFLDIMTDVAGRSDAPEQVRADIQTLMDWFGVKDLDEWNSLSLAEKRQFHEQFARGFEQYLRDGEAPSSKLAEIFKQFKDWLISIYKSSKELDVELTDEVRGVYDRMLATDREIEAKREADTPSLFGEEVTQAANELVNSSTLPDETRAVIRDGLDAMGIKTEPPKGQDPLYGVMSDEEFVQNRFNLDMEKYGDMTILDENNNEISMREYVAEQVAAAERMENDANGISRAALCMFGNNAFD